MTSAKNFDQLLDDFDAAWNSKAVPSIGDYLSTSDDSRRRELLIELVMIDLEYRWRTPGKAAELCAGTEELLPWFPLLRDYQRAFPLLGDNNSLPLPLIAEEYRVRTRWGDRPTREQYLCLYQELGGELPKALDKVDAELFPADRSNAAFTPQDSSPSPTDLLSGKTAREQLQVGDLVDDFRLLNKLGSGAFADVFLAQQRSMHRLVALKVSETLTQEPKVLSVLNHPNIVRVYDERRLQGLSLLYMQYVSGGNLREILDQSRVKDSFELSGQVFLDSIRQVLESKGEIPSVGRRLSPVQQMDWPTTVAWIGAGLADALQHAHEQDIFHRDLKPENVLVTAGGRPMLVDFNLGFGESLTGDNQDMFGGSLAYMSPQQLEVLLDRRDPNDVGAESDFYSLSIVLWELLTGSRPFADDQLQEGATLKSLLELRQEGPDLTALPNNCPGGLKKFLVENLVPTTPAQPAQGPSYLRRLQLALLPEVDRLLVPPPESKQAQWAKQPTFWILLLGLLPNVLISLLNIWANDRLTTHDFDREFFWGHQLPVVNTINYAVGTFLALAILWPLLKHSWGDGYEKLTAEERVPLGYRCLAAPGWIALVILVLWIGSGIAFPLWNRVAPESTVGWDDSLVFLSSQILHGVIAAATTFVLVSLVLVTALFPQLIADREDRQGQARLHSYQGLLKKSVACLAVSPLLAILLLALTERGDDRAEQPVFVMLALVGFLGHWIISKVTPYLNSKVAALEMALAPTHQLVGKHSLEAAASTSEL